MPYTDIEVHFEEMKSLGERLSEIAKQMQQAIDNDGMQTVMGIKAVWISENADTFIGKEIQILNHMCETAASLGKLAEEIKEEAKKIYQVEKWNVLTAKARIYQ